MKKCKVVRFFSEFIFCFLFIGAIAYIALSNSKEVNSAEQKCNDSSRHNMYSFIYTLRCIQQKVKGKNKSTNNYGTASGC